MSTIPIPSAPPLHSVISLDNYRSHISGRDLDTWMSYVDYNAKWLDRYINDAITFYEFIYDTQIAVKYVNSMNSYVWKRSDGTLVFNYPRMFNVTLAMWHKPKRCVFRNNGNDDIYHMLQGYLKKYEGLEFCPAKTSIQMLNTWIGFKAKLLSDDDYDSNAVNPFLYHITQVICSGHTDQATWVLDWLASLIQTPEKRYDTALILYSNVHGTGKTALIRFLVNAIIGNTHATSCYGLGTLFETYSTMRENKLLLNIREPFTDKEIYMRFKDKFKDAIVSDSITITPKRQTKYTTKNYTKFCMTTNHIDSIPHNDHFTLIHVSDKHKDDSGYFKMLYDHFEDPYFADQVFTYLTKRTINSNLHTSFISRSTVTNVDSLTQFTDHIIQSDYRYGYIGEDGGNHTLDLKHHKIEQSIFIEAYKHYIRLHNLKKVSMRKKKIDKTLPNDLAVTRSRKLNKELIYFKNLTYATI